MLYGFGVYFELYMLIIKMTIRTTSSEMNRLNIKVPVLAFKNGTCGKAEVACLSVKVLELLTGTDQSVI